MTQATLDASVKIGGKDIAVDEVFDLVIEADLDQPDMAVITLSNQSTQWSSMVKEGDPLEVRAGFTSGKEQGTVFKGEVVGIEPIFSSSGPARVLVRGLNALHKLARGKKSVSYTKVTDKDIVNKIVGNYGLSANFGDSPPSTKYDHVYQHNQTDLEFLRLRAARIGFEVLVQDTTLYFKKRTEKESGIKLTIGQSGETTLERFLPRLSTANQVSEVRVRGWDPEQKKEILGVATPSGSKLGDKTGSQIANNSHKNVLYVDVDVPVFTKEDADAIAKSLLQDRLMNFITGDATAKGNPDLKPGIVVEISVGDKRFDGKYYITAVRHRYQHEGADHGFRTHFKFKRDAESNT
jgi:phage protein D